MRLLREATVSFAGGVNDSVAQDEYLANQCQVMLNARPSLLGNASVPYKGERRLCTGYNWTFFGSSTCFGAIEFYTSAGVQQIIAAFDDVMYQSTDGGVTFSPISGATGLDEEYWSFAIISEGGTPILCCANGATASYEWDGTTWSTIANIPSGTKYLAVHANRLIASGYSGAQVAASKVGDIEVWATPDGWVVNADDGSDGADVTGLYTLGGLVLVFKSRSFGYTEGYGYQTLQVAAGARGISRSVGCIAHRSIVAAGDGAVMWLSERGFEFWTPGSAVQLVSGFQQRFVDKIGRDAVDAQPGLPSAMWVPDRQEYWCAVPLGIGGVTTTALLLDATDVLTAGVGDPVNTWIYVYRPATSQRPAAAYFIYPTLASLGSFSVDSGGMLALTADDRTGQMGFVDEHGMLALCRLPDPGLWGVLDKSDCLDLAAPSSGPATLFTAARGLKTAAPFAGTHENGITVLDEAPQAESPNIVRNGGFGSADQWTLTGVAAIGSGVLTLGTAGDQATQEIPLVGGHTYMVSFVIRSRTAGSLRVDFGQQALFFATNGPHSYEREFSANENEDYAIVLISDSSFDGVVDDVVVRDTTAPETPIAMIRTRPLTFGDEFTRKKAKRIGALISQPFAHTVTAYAIVDGSYQAAQSLAYTASDAPQEQRARVGGRGRVIQAEFHVEAESIIDGIEVVAQPLGDEI